MDNKQFYIKEFDNNYYYNFKAEYRFFKFIEYYVRTRIFDMRLFKENMDLIIDKSATRNMPAYKRILTEEYWKISDDEFSNIIDEVIDNIKSGEIEIIDLVKLYAYFNYFSKKKLIKYNITALKNLFIDGMNIASVNSRYCEDVEKELSKIAIQDEEKEMEEVLKKFYSLNEQLKDKMYKEKADEIFKYIPMRMERFYDIFEKECMDIPIFKYQEPHQMFQRILCASNEDIMIIKEKLINRAELNGCKLKEETKNIKQLKQIIEAYMAGKEISIKTVMLNEFAKDLDYILGKINN